MVDIARKYSRVTSLVLSGKPNFDEPVERAGEVVDRVVGDGQRTVSALVVHLEPVVDDVLLAHLEIVGDARAGDRFAPAALVQTEVGVDQIALVLEQPLDAVERAAAFLVGRERDDDIAIRLESLTLVPNQIRDPDRGLRLVVADAAAVEVAVLLGERERIHAPVFALRLDDVGVREQQNRPALPGAVVAHDQVRLRRTRSAHEDVGGWEAGGLETLGHRLGDRRRRASRVARLDLDHLLVDRAGELPLGVRRHSAILRVKGGPAEQRADGDVNSHKPHLADAGNAGSLSTSRWSC